MKIQEKKEEETTEKEGEEEQGFNNLLHIRSGEVIVFIVFLT